MELETINDVEDPFKFIQTVQDILVSFREDNSENENEISHNIEVYLIMKKSQGDLFTYLYG